MVNLLILFYKKIMISTLFMPYIFSNFISDLKYFLLLLGLGIGLELGLNMG